MFPATSAAYNSYGDAVIQTAIDAAAIQSSFHKTINHLPMDNTLITVPNTNDIHDCTCDSGAGGCHTARYMFDLSCASKRVVAGRPDKMRGNRAWAAYLPRSPSEHSVAYVDAS